MANTKKSKKTATKPSKKSDLTRLTINMRTIAKESTKMNIGKDALLEARAYTEGVFIPFLMRLSETCAKQEKKKTIQERDMIRARDYLNVLLSSL